MKYEDINNASKAQTLLNRLSHAKSGMQRRQSLIEKEKPDCGGIPNVADIGYLCVISDHSDGSGNMVDLRGCYIAKEINEAVLNVLEAKEEELMLYLLSLGVEKPQKDTTE